MQCVFLYVRVSTEEQAIHGLSIEAQSASLKEWAKRSLRESHPCTPDRPRRRYTGLGPQRRGFPIQQVSCLVIQLWAGFIFCP